MELLVFPKKIYYALKNRKRFVYGCEKEGNAPMKINYFKCIRLIKFFNLFFYVFNKTLVLSIICSKCGDDNDRVLNEEGSIDILKLLSLTK